VSFLKLKQSEDSFLGVLVSKLVDVDRKRNCMHDVKDSRGVLGDTVAWN